MLAANIPLKKLENTVFRGTLESGFGLKLPSEAIFQKYVPECYEAVFQTIKQDLKEGPVWISADCSRDVKGREVTNVVIGCLDSQEYHKPHLVHVAFFDKSSRHPRKSPIERQTW